MAVVAVTKGNMHTLVIMTVCAAEFHHRLIADDVHYKSGRKVLLISNVLPPDVAASSA
jgi:hypothetical protein